MNVDFCPQRPQGSCPAVRGARIATAHDDPFHAVLQGSQNEFANSSGGGFARITKGRRNQRQSCRRSHLDYGGWQTGTAEYGKVRVDRLPDR